MHLQKENSGIPVLAFAGWSGTGKTTLIERLIPFLREKGLRLAVIKHDAHGIDVDREGKDSWRFSRAGAEIVAVSAKEKTAWIEQRELGIWDVLGMVHDVDLILVEGYKNESISQIGICRRAAGKGFTSSPDRYEALATDLEPEELEALAAEHSRDKKQQMIFEMPKEGRRYRNIILRERGISDRKLPVYRLEDIEGIAEFIMQNMDDFTHFNARGRAKMVDVGEKSGTKRTAVAAASVLVSPETFTLIRTGGMKKGDVLTVAQIAGVMGAKHTPDIIPMCHPILLGGIDLDLSLNEEKCSVEIRATVSCEGKTGVEMEALTAVSTAALTIYDMCKAVQKDIVISEIKLLEKTGGIHGDFHRQEG